MMKMMMKGTGMLVLAAVALLGLCGPAAGQEQMGFLRQDGERSFYQWLTDPNADKVPLWDDSANVWVWTDLVSLTAGAVKETHLDLGLGAGQISAVDFPIGDVGTFFATDNIEAALQELGAAWGTFESTAELDVRDAANRDRANHTGNQLLATISDAGSAAAADLIDDDSFATATPANVPSAESVKTYVDTNTETPAELDVRDAANRDRANHTGTQLLATISDAGSAAAADLIDDDSFATATPTNVPSAESVKTYVDTAVAGGGGGGGGDGKPVEQDLGAGTELTIGEAYFVSGISADRTLTFSGTPNDGDMIWLRLINAAAEVTLTIPSSFRLLETATTTTLVFVPGNHEIVWEHSNGAWHVKDSGGKEVESETFVLVEPDQLRLLSDDFVLKRFDVLEYPRGVTVLSFRVTSSASYTSEDFLFEAWSDRVGSVQTELDTVTHTGQDTAGGALVSSAIGAGEFLVLNFDNTPEDIPIAEVEVIWEIN